MTGHDDTAGVLAPPPLIFAGGLGLGWGLDAAFGLPALPLAPLARVGLGHVGTVAGAVLIVAAIFALRKARTAVEPWKPTTAIVSDGVFAWSRNPIYLGMAWVFAGVATGLASLGMLILLPVTLLVIHVGVIRREERYLEARFGAPYRLYVERVRRWI